MRKVILSAIIALFAFASSNAQVIISQNFDAPTTIPALPSTWSQSSTGTPGWKSSVIGSISAWATQFGATSPTHSSQFGVVDDWNDSVTNNLHDTLMSPTFSLVGTVSSWLNFDYYFWGATRTSTGNSEEARVIGSTDGGVTWTSLGTLNGTGNVWKTAHVDLSSLGTGASVKIGFVYSDGTDHLMGLAVDDIEVVNLTTSSAKVTQLGYNNVTNGISANGEPVAFMLENSGMTITSFDAQFSINGGTPITQSFTGVTVAAYSQQAFSFTSPIAGAVAGTNTIKVVITNVNTVANTDVDSAKSSTFTLASATTQRQGLIEEFSSSTCPPCRALNMNYDPLALSLNFNESGTDINIIKYQMNWPSPGNDRSYNSDGATRQSYYGVTGIPDHFVNGAKSTVSTSPFSAANMTTEANNSKALKSFIDMSVTYTVDTNTHKLGVVLDVTPHFTKTGNYHVYIALLDKYYENTTNTTGQLKYYHAMRKMLPSASGHAVTSWTDGVTKTFNDTDVSYTNGIWENGVSEYPAQGSSKFWNNPMTGSEVVAFVEEDATKSIMQSIVSIPGGFVNVSTLAKVDNISIYPNPTSGKSTLSFNLIQDGNVRVTVMDYTGKLVSEVTNKTMNAGAQNVTINSDNIAPGNYIVVISTKDGNKAERLTVK